VKEVESKYRVVRSRYGRTVAGAVDGWIRRAEDRAQRPRLFAAAGRFSSALGASDPKFAGRFTAYREQLYTIYGPARNDTRTANDVLLITAKAKPESAPALYSDCRTGDGLIDSNRKLVAVLQKRGFKYENHAITGAHTWDLPEPPCRGVPAVAGEGVHSSRSALTGSSDIARRTGT